MKVKLKDQLKNSSSFLIAMVFCSMVNAQADSNNLIAYSSEYEFKEGIYLNFEQLKSNSPIAKARILASEDLNDADFFKNLLDKPKLYFFDSYGTKQEIESSKVWGYCRNNILYVNVNGSFFRITYMGNISHFLASYTYITQPSQYGYYGVDNYRSTSDYNKTQEVKQMILDFQTGKILEFNLKNIEIILARDPELYNQFTDLRRKKQKQLKFVYLRKYNERNPLYLPLDKTF
jgi:hypothetical protein